MTHPYHAMMPRGRLARFVIFIAVLAGCDSTSTEPPPGATEEPRLPTEVAGSALDVTVLAGESLVDTTNQAWREALDAMGIVAADLSLTIAIPEDSTVDLEMGSLRIAGWDWAPRLQSFADEIEAAGGGVIRFDQREIGERSVLVATRTDDSAVSASYYFPAGEVLFFLRAGTGDLAAEALRKLSPGSGATPNSATPAVRAAAAGSPAFKQLGQILLSTPTLHSFPVCVGGPSAWPPQMITVTGTVLSSSGIFPYQMSLSAHTPFGTTLPSAVYGFSYTFRYESRQYGHGTAETLRLHASAPATTGPVEMDWPIRVQHCLNGLWEDGPRILDIRQGILADVTATVQEGTLVCGEGGQAFSGTLETTGPVGTLAGSDLKVCNPEACVEAGHLEKTEFRNYVASVSDDGSSVDVRWERQLFDRTYDEDGNLTACPATEVVEETFSIRRLIFGPDSPF